LESALRKSKGRKRGRKGGRKGGKEGGRKEREGGWKKGRIVV
jgi:hypothetical protein